MKKIPKNYAAVPGSRITDSEAKIVGPELERIEKATGCLKPESVVELAAPDDAPLHPFFEWRDTVAAKKFREDQARNLIRSVVVQIEDSETTPVRAFVSVTSAPEERNFEGSAYISTARALKNTDYRAQVLEDALNELNSFRTRYQHLRELADVFRAIEAVAV